MCIENGCNTRPNYNFISEPKALYCVVHKKDNMVDVKNKRCIENGCNKQQSFNFIGKTNPLYC